MSCQDIVGNMNCGHYPIYSTKADTETGMTSVDLEILELTI